MPKFLLNESLNMQYGNGNYFVEEDPEAQKIVLSKPQHNEEKREYDFKDSDVEDVEKLTNSKVLYNIGYGGFSTVKLIYNNQQKSFFAMKVVNLRNKKFKKKSPSKNRDFINQEILVNFNAKNNHIVKLFGYFNHKDYVMLILEYMNNRDLKHYMKKFHQTYGDENFSELLTGFFIIQILKAMGYLKYRNILHRDIKPENIMLNTNYVCKLGDFSLSRKLDLSSNFKTSRSGTLPYLPPECVKKKMTIKSIYCEKLDLFSLGIVMYFMLFNKHPFNYKSHMTCTEYSKILHLTSLSFEGNNISDCCRDFLKGLLEKKYTDRFSFERTLTHPWLVLIKKKVEDIVEKFQNDSEKMISILNSTKVTNDFFNNKNYQEIQLAKEESLEQQVIPEELVGKKRQRV